MTDKEVKIQRRKSSASSTKSPKKSSRPPSSHENPRFPKLAIPKRDDPSHFGIPTPTSRAPPVVSQPQPIPFRPRPSTSQTYPRPQSYHAAYTSGGYGTGPPLSNSAYYTNYTIPPPSYPPPSPSYFRYAVTGQQDYFSTPTSATPVSARPLEARFAPVQNPVNYDTTSDPIQRTTSAYGVRDPVPRRILESAYSDGYNSASEGPVRRVSIRAPSSRTKQEEDYDLMPPPARPGILRNAQTEYYADAPESQSRRDSRSVYRDDPPPARRPSLRRGSVSYDLPDSDRVQVFEQASAGRRRQSYYGPSTDSTGSSDYVDKFQQAQTYQENVAGPPVVPLTADMLKRQQRRQARSSGSTKSSGSRDESDYKKSATTRTTRSGSHGDDENVTIKVTGTARVTVGGAEIECRDGGEIEIKHQKAIRNGSERGSNSEWGGTQRDRIEGDRRSRADRPPVQSRMSSRSNGGPGWI